MKKGRRHRERRKREGEEEQLEKRTDPLTLLSTMQTERRLN